MKRRAFFILDVIVGLMLLIVLTTVLAVTVTRQSAAARHLAGDRAALRAAEAKLV
jgi:hypothetical protein